MTNQAGPAQLDIRPPPPRAMLETVLYASDLGAAEAFYRDVLGLVPAAQKPGRHLFYRLDGQMLLIFDPVVTAAAPQPGGLAVPPHGTSGPGHACFAATDGEMNAWRNHLGRLGVAIEAEITWPAGGRSIYFCDPAGNCLEFAEPKMWGL